MEGDSRISESNTRTSTNTMEISIAEASSMFPGFRFSPTDEELICFYLRKKIEGLDSCVEVIPEVDICKYEPWDLPAKSIIQSDNEWFFFSTRGKKYPSGSQSKRSTERGYWKATGKERNVKSGSAVIGTKRTLVFHTGRAPEGQRTEWIMHEYCMNEKPRDLLVVCRLRRNTEFNLEETSRKKSQERRQSSDLNTNANTSSGVEQVGQSDGANVADCCSKECSSSYNCQSVEQADLGFELDNIFDNELYPHASSSHQKECESDEEDWFADIMKDEIIKLDDPTICLTPQPSRMPEPDPESQQPVSIISSRDIPFHQQGTANRRLRLRRVRSKPFATFKVNNVSSPNPSKISAIVNSKSIRFKRLVHLSMLASLVILVSIILYVQFGDFLRRTTVKQNFLYFN